MKNTDSKDSKPSNGNDILSKIYGTGEIVFKSTGYTPGAIANRILYEEGNKDRKINHMKLQKLLYLVYGAYLKKYEELIFDTHLEAWKHGPVVEPVYNFFKTRGNDPIPYKYSAFMREAWSKDDNSPDEFKKFFLGGELDSRVISFHKNPKEIEKNIIEIIEIVCDKCKDKDGRDLSEITHRKDKKGLNPWIICRNFGHENNIQNVVLPPILIKKFFGEYDLDQILGKDIYGQ